MDQLIASYQHVLKGRFLLLFCILTFLTSLSHAQSDIAEMEYYIDNDPGFGNGIAISISTGSVVDLVNEIISTSTLPVGHHMIGVRARNVAGVWGFTEKRAFYIPPGTTADPPIAAISEIEYYIDNDPGTGNAISIAVSTSNLIDLPSEILNTSTLPAGFHTLGVRAKNTDNVWGLVEKREFYIPPGTTTDPPVANITELEYFFDVDPGHGNAIPLTASGNVIDINPIIPQSLSEGHHTLHIRAKNSDGRWGITESRKVYVKQATSFDTTYDIVKMEYFFDGVDPGFGNAIDLPIVSGAVVDFNTVDVPTPPTLVDGQHQITFRAQNELGTWGVGETSNFDVLDDCTQPTASFNVNLACAGESLQFVDNSLDIDIATVSYRWYVDDNLVANTIGDALHTINNPGDYTISLAIRQGTICFDSTSVDITVKPKPIVTFSAERVELGNPTVFDINAFNVDPSAIWEWDFDEDGIIDSNSSSSVSFTYAAVGTYLVNLRVSDQMGCETTHQQNVTVDPVNSGGGTPVVVFNASEVVVGNPTSFTVAFQSNVDPTWSWSWDFDTDGTEDDTTKGDTNFTYPQAGSYTATLTIDDGNGNTYDFTASVTVHEPLTGSPVVVFSTTTATIPDETIYTIDHQADIEADWEWSWDFDTNGTVDDNTKGNTSYAFPTPGEYVTTLTITDNLSNDYTFTELVRVLPEVVVLNVFNVVTFNGDGINDFLQIENIEALPSNKVLIYDRTGLLVFEMNEYDNNQRVFRGRSNINGSRELPQGNYFYTIDRGDGSNQLTGFLYLKR